MRLLTAVLIVALETTGVRQEAPAKPRPPDDLPLTRLKADATVVAVLTPGAVATKDALWFATAKGLARVDAASNALTAPVTLEGPACGGLAVGSGAIWAPRCGEPPVLSRVDEQSLAVTIAAVRLFDPAGLIAASVGSVWLATDKGGVVSRVDPDTREVVAEVFLAHEPSSVVAGKDALWVTSAAGNTLTRVEPHTNAVVETITVGPRPGRLAVADAAVWVLNRGDDSVSRVDPKTNKVVATIAVGHGAGAGDIAAGEGAVFLSAAGSPLVRIDPESNRATHRFTGEGGGAVIVAHGSVWIAATSTATWRLDPRLISATRP